MDARLREGIGLFNDRSFFECHEVLEGFYLETDDANKPFLEGLIQLAAAFRIFADFAEIKGPVRMVRQALIRFENYQPAFMQVRVSQLSSALEVWAKATEAGSAPAPSIPKIQMQGLGLFS